MRHLPFLLLLTACVPDAEPFELQAPVVERVGRWPQDERCHVLVEPAMRWGLNCRVVVECGQTPLWGGSRMGGYANCDVEERTLTRGENGESLWQLDMRFDRDRLVLTRMNARDQRLVLDISSASETP